MDCWVGDTWFLNAIGDDSEGVELAELLRLGLEEKLGGQGERASVAVAEFLQERATDQVRATRAKSIVDLVMQDRALFEQAGSQPIAADCVLRYLNDTLNRKPCATKHLGI